MSKFGRDIIGRNLNATEVSFEKGECAIVPRVKRALFSSLKSLSGLMFEHNTFSLAAKGYSTAK